MSFAREITEIFQDFRRAVKRRLEAELHRFAVDIEQFVYQLLEEGLPANWRVRLAGQLAQWEHERPGIVVQDRAVLEKFIVDWARAWGLTVPDESAGGPSEIAPTQPSPSTSRKVTSGQQFFDDKLADARARLEEMKARLETLGARIDAAKVDEPLDVEADADEFDSLIWLYNDALEGARDAWLRDHLPGEANTRLLKLPTPASLGLLLFADADQLVRANRQAKLIAIRLHQHDVAMDWLVYAAEKAEIAGTVAGIGAGGGIVIKAGINGGRWAVVKAVAAAAAAAAVEHLAEKGLRAAGANETTIRGARLAAAIIGLILLHRMAKRVSSQNPKPITKPKPRTLETSKNRARSPQDAKRKAGVAFNRARKGVYTYDEVPIEKPSGGRPYFLDSYDPVKGEIIFRRDTQFSEIQFRTAQTYFREFVKKYPPGSTIANVESTPEGLAGTKLKGTMIFEVPPQWKRIPLRVLDEAARYDIVIRDSNGRVYHAN